MLSQPPPLEPGAFVTVRHRRWLVERVAAPTDPGDARQVSLTCIDDDAIGETADILWEAEPAAQVITASAWADL